MARIDKSARVTAAVEAFRRGEFSDYNSAADAKGCSRSAVSRRVRGLTKTRQQANSFWHQCLTIEQEEVLIERINYLSDRAMPPTSHIVRNLAEEIRGKRVGKNWVGQFVKRHDIRLKSLYLRNIDSLRAGAEYAPMFQLFFSVLAMVIEKYKITAENIYNFDEKGFMIGFGRSLKRIITAAALSSGRVTKARQDGSREFISCLACISAIGRWIPPALIYKGESGHLMSTWVDDVTTESKAHFTVSHNGWSNNAIGLTWLKTIFERYTKPKRTTQKRLLIVDGHSSHVNIAFVDWADQHGIILLILPPHTTHRLQPLDVGLFQPLSTYYSVEINDLLDSSLGTVGMTKGLFWKYFKPAFDEAFTEENIQSAFRKSGIWPTDGSAIIKMITRPTLAPEVQDQELRTPKDSKAIRRFQLAYDREPTADKVKKLFATTLHLSAQVSCLQHQNEGLFKAIELQKKKGRQGVRLNLCGEPNKGIIDCYSPAKVVKAREYQEQKEALKAAEDKAKLERKIQRAANALKNKQDKERKAKAKAEKEAKAAREQMAKELAAAVKKALQEEQNSTAPKAKKAAPTVSKQPKPAPGVKAPVKLSSRRSVVVPAPSVVDVVVEARRTATRTITRPARFT